MANLRLAVRTLLKNPFITAVAVASLALGIGVNAAIFSLFDQMLLRPLPVPAPGRARQPGRSGPEAGFADRADSQGSCDVVFSYPMFRDLERAQQSFTGIAAHRSFGANLSYRGQTMNGDGMMVSGSYFSLLGLQPAIGRLLTPQDDQTIGGHPIVVLEPRVLADGASTRLATSSNERSSSTVKRSPSWAWRPRDFYGTMLGSRPHVFVPMTMRGRCSQDSSGRTTTASRTAAPTSPICSRA